MGTGKLNETLRRAFSGVTLRRQTVDAGRTEGTEVAAGEESPLGRRDVERGITGRADLMVSDPSPTGPGPALVFMGRAYEPGKPVTLGEVATVYSEVAALLGAPAEVGPRPSAAVAEAFQFLLQREILTESRNAYMRGAITEKEANGLLRDHKAPEGRRLPLRIEDVTEELMADRNPKEIVGEATRGDGSVLLVNLDRLSPEGYADFYRLWTLGQLLDRLPKGNRREQGPSVLLTGTRPAYDLPPHIKARMAALV